MSKIFKDFKVFKCTNVHLILCIKICNTNIHPTVEKLKTVSGIVLLLRQNLPFLLKKQSPGLAEVDLEIKEVLEMDHCRGWAGQVEASGGQGDQAEKETVSLCYWKGPPEYLNIFSIVNVFPKERE